MIKFCEYCLEDVLCTYHENVTTLDIEGVKINYLRKYYVCSECNHEFLDDLYDYDVITVHNLLRESYKEVDKNNN